MRVFRDSLICLTALIFLIFTLRMDKGRGARAASKPLDFSTQSQSKGSISEKPRCGLIDDKQVRIPSNWDSFAPPPPGQSYVDPAFGCSVERLTDSSRDETAWDGKHLSFMHYYSTLTPINVSDSMLFVVSNDGNWRIKNVNGSVVIPAAKIPQSSPLVSH